MTMRYILPLTLLVSTTCVFNTRTVALTARDLSHIDGNLINDDSVLGMIKYQYDIKKFFKKTYDLNGVSYSLYDLAVLERDNKLPQGSERLFAAMLQGFVDFSHQFIEELRPVKKILGDLVCESCTLHKRPDSLLLVWIKSGNVDEITLLKQNVTSFRGLGNLCKDLLNFTGDMMDTCPKATSACNDFIRRVKELTPLLDEILVSEGKKVDHASEYHKNMIRYVADRYNMGEEITKSKTVRLYKNYQSTYTKA
jgi:hypothetical protein